MTDPNLLEEGTEIPLYLYDPCAREGCLHYFCEHGFGGTTSVAWSRNPEEVGREISLPDGCMNDGCGCPEFLDRDTGEPITMAMIEAVWGREANV